LLTAVISVVAEGTIRQIIFGASIALIFMKLYGYYAPFIKDDDDRLQELAQYQIFLTLFISLLIRVASSDESEEGKDYIGTLDIILILVNMSSYSLIMYQYSSRLFISDKPIHPILNSSEDEASAKKDSETSDLVELPSAQAMKDIEMGSTTFVFESSKQNEQLVIVENYEAPHDGAAVLDEFFEMIRIQQDESSKIEEMNLNEK
jgi:hypothetical protein